MKDSNSIVAVYDAPADAVEGANDLHKAGFDMSQLSIAVREFPGPDHVVGCSNTGAQIKYWGRVGILWGELAGYWAGAGFFELPGVGPVLLAGPLVSSVVAIMDGSASAGGASVFGGGLRRLGIPKECIGRYEAELCGRRLLLIAHGTPEELIHAKDVLHLTHPSELNVHFAVQVLGAGKQN